MRGLDAEYDFTAALARVNRPILVVEGADSRLPLEPARVWARKAPDARLLLIKRSGHRTWLDRPSELFEALEQFFGDGWPSGALEVRDSPITERVSRTGTCSSRRHVVSTYSKTKA